MKIPFIPDIEAIPVVAPQIMTQVDARAIAAGTPGTVLMDRAGSAIAEIARRLVSRRPVSVLAGPGQNGGDGWVVARRLREVGWPVAVVSDWPVGALTGDAATAAKNWGIDPAPLSSFEPDENGLVIDALFGAGLSRPVDGPAAEAIKRCGAIGALVIAADLPSGLDGATGEIRGIAPRCRATVTFGAPKPGHFLGEGSSLCGELHVADIGLSVRNEDAAAFRNHPRMWQGHLPFPPQAPHKYARGAVLVIGGGRHTGGAARLTASAAARAGAGATTIAVTPQAADITAARVDAVMVHVIREDGVAPVIDKSKYDAAAIGPGLGQDRRHADWLGQVLDADIPAVLDADAITILASRPDLRKKLGSRHVLTPHEGEFARLFPDFSGDALSRAVMASAKVGATVLLKGATSVIATPGERPILNTGATSYLATAGSGDVLTGIICALLAQGVMPHKAAAAGSFLHAAAGAFVGAGLTADDLPTAICNVIARMERKGHGTR